MTLSFRAKIFAFVGCLAIPFVILTVSTNLIDDRVDAELVRIEQRHLPRIEAAPKLDASFESLSRSFQDAVGAQDLDALDRCRMEKDAFQAALTAAKAAFEPADAAALQAAVEAWYLASDGVARRLISGETGEPIVEAIAEMQRKRAAARSLLDRMSTFDRRELASAFADARQAQATGRRVHILVTVTCLSFFLLLTFWLTRNVLTALRALTSGFERFGRGDFSIPIVTKTADELAAVAEQANTMARNLEKMADEQERAAKIESDLLEELRTRNESLTEYAEQLVEQRTELEEARQALEVKARELADVSAYKSQFLANMSHELRTPLNAVIGFAEVLLQKSQGPLTDAQQRSLLDIEAAGRQLLALVNDILDLSKVEAGRLEIETSNFDLGQVAHDAMTLVGTQAKRKRIALENTVASSACRGDPYRTRQVLANLLSNAVKFTPDEGRVGLSARREGDIVRVEVVDSGVGVSEEDAARLFRPFTQLDAARTGGTGLGLSICKKLVEAMGGTIGFSSAVGKGSTFWFTLPAASAVAPAKKETVAIAPEPAGDRTSVLVVDDTEANRRVVRAMLAPTGFEVLEAANASEAIELARSAQPALVLMDIRMPGEDGLEATRRLRADPSTAKIPVVVISAQAMTSDREAALEAGCVAYLAKPVGRKELVDVVRFAIEKARAGDG